jgi:hypothetical protein
MGGLTSLIVSPEFTSRPAAKEPIMPDPDPSDFGSARPVNRVALFTRFGLFEAVGFPNSAREASALGHVVNLDQPDGMKDIVPELTRATRDEFDLPSLNLGSMYRGVYDFVKHQINAGETDEGIRSRLLSNVEGIAELSDLIRQAVEEALADHPPRY